MANLRIAIVLLLVLPCSTARARVAPKTHFRAQSHRNTSSVVLSHDIAELADKCQCTYTGDCGCEAAVKFMKCMKNACKVGGSCQGYCPKDTYEKSCKDWQFACNKEHMGDHDGDDVDISCTKEKLTCEEGKDSFSYEFPSISKEKEWNPPKEEKK
eukprot:gnl/TRDRNA2_/TRDRNA2_61718_c0_seq1.p1 gnl/TRDRNA2_/TRDRNA2_61718_c0~~gnl/TRDRNA2_/TRDRNA2_61718_c0_seq1.p1  ORF type:complete len:156 (+),score=32.03 gnl/TRDRNA2_/TRDRNA2_61718_c0_seq1:126-593(+)